MSATNSSSASAINVTAAERRIKPSVANRSRSFGCATLRRTERSSTEEGMASKKNRTELPTSVTTDTSGVIQPGAYFLRTKLLPPRPAPEMLSRPRLLERLRANLDRPITLIAANAGSGKTTLVADFLRQQDRPYIWYQLDH